MASFNSLILLGNLTREPAVKYLQTGKAVCEFGIAVNKKMGGDKPDRVLFIDVTLFDKRAEAAGEYLKKGSPVLVSGELQLDQWEQDGQKRSKHKMLAHDFQMMPRGQGGQHESPRDEVSQVNPSLEDAPF
jgi:single-strand DNA-binding protein